MQQSLEHELKRSGHLDVVRLRSGQPPWLAAAAWLATSATSNGLSYIVGTKGKTPPPTKMYPFQLLPCIVNSVLIGAAVAAFMHIDSIYGLFGF